jgi:hypothetical protein
VNFKEEGIALTNGLNGVAIGTALHWRTPVSGLMLGASFQAVNKTNSPFVDTYVVPAGPSQGVTITTPGTMVLEVPHTPDFFGRYEKNRFMIAGEYERTVGYLQLNGLSPYPENIDIRPWYAMTSYKVTDKLTAGVYSTQEVNRQSALGPARYYKDWAISGRYDFNQYLYAKAEQHFVDGTAVGYDTDLNPGGLKPTTKLTVLKIGVSF